MLYLPFNSRAWLLLALLMPLHAWSHATPPVSFQDLRLTFDSDDRAMAGLLLRLERARSTSGPRIQLLRIPMRPAARTALRSRPGLEIQAGSIDAGTYRVEALALVDKSGGHTILAAGVEDTIGNLTSWHWFRQPPGERGTELNLAALEHLYAMALRQPATRRVQFKVEGNTVDGRKGSFSGSSLPHLLRHLAALRMREAVSSGSSVIPWRIVSVEAVRLPSDPSKPIRVRLLEGSRPLSNERVVLERAPHHACAAVSGADGTAECVLQDTHGTGQDHEEEPSSVPVVASYPGELRSDSIKLPTAVPLSGSKHRGSR